MGEVSRWRGLERLKIEMLYTAGPISDTVTLHVDARSTSEKETARGEGRVPEQLLLLCS